MTVIVCSGFGSFSGRSYLLPVHEFSGTTRAATESNLVACSISNCETMENAVELHSDGDNAVSIKLNRKTGTLKVKAGCALQLALSDHVDLQRRID